MAHFYISIHISGYEAKDIINNSTSKLIVKSFEDKSFDEMQILSKQILEIGDYIILFSSMQDMKVLLTHNGNFDFSCGKLFKEHLSKFNDLGGRGDKLAQEAFQNIEDLKQFEKYLEEILKAQI